MKQQVAHDETATLAILMAEHELLGVHTSFPAVDRGTLSGPQDGLPHTFSAPLVPQADPSNPPYPLVVTTPKRPVDNAGNVRQERSPPSPSGQQL